MKTFGDTLKQLRIERNMTGKELGAVFNVTKTAISNWENGNRFPDQDVLKSISDFFGVTLDYLLGKSDSKGNASLTSASTDAAETEVDSNLYIEVSSPEVKKLFALSKDLTPEQLKVVCNLVELTVEEIKLNSKIEALNREKEALMGRKKALGYGNNGVNGNNI